MPEVKLRSILLVGLACGALVAGTASVQVFGSQGDEFCPQLPSGSGYVWEWVQVDSGYCVGRVAKTRETAFEFRPLKLQGFLSLVEPGSPIKSGSVGGMPVRWFRSSAVTDTKISYEAFVVIDKVSQRYASIRVFGTSESQMDERLKVLERVELR
jgi:hypothetical protein